MKKISLVLVLFILAAVAFAETQLFLDVHYSLLGELAGPGITMGFGKEKFDILTSFDLWVERDYSGSTETTTISFWHGLYVGIAPKAAVSEKLTLSLPILFKFYRHAYIEKEDNPGGKKTEGQNHLRLDAGARAYYAVNQRWSVYAGFQMNIIEVAGANKTKLSGSFTDDTYDDDTFGLSSFRDGSIDLGVKFNF